MNDDWVYRRMCIWRPCTNEPDTYDRIKAGISSTDYARWKSGATGAVALVVNDGDIVQVQISSIIECEPFRIDD